MTLIQATLQFFALCAAMIASTGSLHAETGFWSDVIVQILQGNTYWHREYTVGDSLASGLFALRLSVILPSGVPSLSVTNYLGNHEHRPARTLHRASDGTTPPALLVHKAAAAGITTLGLPITTPSPDGTSPPVK